MDNSKKGKFFSGFIKVFDSIKDSIAYGIQKALNNNNPLSKLLLKFSKSGFWINFYKKTKIGAETLTEKVKNSDSLKRAKNSSVSRGIKKTIEASKNKWDSRQTAGNPSKKTLNNDKSSATNWKSTQLKWKGAVKKFIDNKYILVSSLYASTIKFGKEIYFKFIKTGVGKSKSKQPKALSSSGKVIHLPEKITDTVIPVADETRNVPNKVVIEKEAKESLPWDFRRAVAFCFRWAIIMGSLGLVALVILLSSIYFGFFGKIPSYTDLHSIKNHTVSQVYSNDGKLIGKYFWQNRTNIAYDSIPKSFINALIATEDVRFFEHSGIDYYSLLRVLVKSILLQNESSGGGSTLTQQLVKNLFPRKRHAFFSTPINKVKEMIAARRLEKTYSKKEILTFYINTVYFGDNTYGLVAASERFFSKRAKELTIEDGAILVGLLKAPAYYNPKKNYDRAVARRNTVLEQMGKYRFLSQLETTELKKKPIVLKYRFLTHNDGLAPYFREQIRMEIQDYLDKNPAKDGKIYNLYTDGLKVYTSLDSRMQHYAEKAVEEHIKELQKSFDNHWKYVDLYKDKKDLVENAQKQSLRYKSLAAAGASQKEIAKSFGTKENMEVFSWNGEKDVVMTPLDSIKYFQKFLQAGFLVVDPKSGYVKAWVGGINHKYFQYDHVRSKRQVGSIFKPIVYAAALKNGLQPCKFIPNQRKIYTEYEDWSPRNADGKYGGYYSMKGGLTNSVNTISVSIAMETGINNVVSLAKDLGITSPLPAVPSIALGTAEISLFDMVGAYTAFANKGMRSTPNYILKIVNNQGEVIYDHKPTLKREDRVLSPSEAELMVEMLQSVVDSGTAARIRYKYNIKTDIAGKTGTTQSNSDGWFIGFTPDLLAGVWVGAEDRRVHFRSTALGQGANMALPIWVKFISQVYNDPEFSAYKNSRFAPPSASANSLLSCELYKENMNIFQGIFDFFKPNKEKEPIIVFPKSTKPKKKTTRPVRKRKKRKNWKYLLKG